MKFLSCLFGAFLLVSCKGDSDSATPGSDHGAENSGKGVSATQSDREAGPLSDRKGSQKDVIVIETSMGTIRAKLHPETAPITVENFLSYVDKKHFDNTIFHRVISDFMIQGGGFEMSGQFPKEKETGSGIINESADTLPNKTGTLAMARTNDPNSATAQFFINVKDNKSLDHSGRPGYAVFGEVIEGMDVVNAIKEVPTGRSMALSLSPDGRYNSSPFSDVPTEPVTIITVRRASNSK